MKTRRARNFRLGNVATLAMLWLLAGCATPGQRQTSSEVAPGAAGELGGAKPVSLFFTGNRWGELEPCGCTVAPMGGVEREFSFLEKNRDAARDLIFASAGTTLVSRHFNPRYREAAVERAKTVVKSLNLLGTEVVAPSADDTRFTAAEWKSFSELAQFHWVSSNLLVRETKKPLFSPRYIHWNGKYPIVFLGVTEGSAKDRGDWVELSDPILSLKRQVADLPPPPRLVVLLSSVSTESREKILKAIPEVDIVLGGIGDRDSEGRYFSSRQVYVNPAGLARAVTRLEFEPMTAFKDIYIPHVAYDAAQQSDSLNRRLDEQKDELAHHPSKKRKTVIGSIIDDLNAQLASLKTIPTFIGSRSLVLSVETTFLDSSFPMANPKFEALLNEYKNALRTIALNPQDPDSLDSTQE